MFNNLFRNNAPFKKEKTVAEETLNYSHLLLDSFVKDATLPELQAEEQSKLTRLKNLGFLSAAETRELDKKKQDIEKIHSDRKKILEIIEFYITAVKVFGPDTVLIKLSDFRKLIVKYGMVCGTFSSYTGSIPDELIPKIESTLRKLNSNNEVKVFDIDYNEDVYKSSITSKTIDSKFFDKIVWLYPLKNIIVEDRVHHIPGYSELLEDLKIFPFIPDISDSYSLERIGWYAHRNLGLDYTSGIRCADYQKAERLFICAPSNEMKSTKMKIIPKTEDPFICSLCLHDTVLIYHMWGEEATDELLNSYKSLSEKIKNIL